MKLPARKTDDYRDYANFYDELKGDRSDKVRLLLDSIAKHRPESRTVIELACGTGTILQGLAGIYDVTGLDISKGMLRQAQKRLPNTPFIITDMASFQIPRTFDVAYCFHNSVNHLLSFERWKTFFTNVGRHLNNQGLFIFDVNPIEKIEGHIAFGPTIIDSEKFRVTTHIVKHQTHPARYYWHVDVVRKRVGIGVIKRSRTEKRSTVTIDVYPDTQIRAALLDHFKILECFTLNHTNAERHDDIGRTYYICQKV